MNRNFYRFIPLLLIAFLSVGVVQAQGDYSRRGNDRTHDRYDRRDRNNRYDRNRGYNNRHYEYNKVRRRPHTPRYIRPIRPSSFHIWIDGSWIWNNGRYYYRNGFWTVPQRGNVWVPGHWQRTHRGWYWVDGFWQYNRNRW